VYSVAQTRGSLPLEQALPKYSLDPPTLDKLKKSIQVSPSNMQACCVSARLWEDLLEAGHRIPFLLVRVADMRMALGSTVLALDLYDEAGDPPYIINSAN
jgi:hypothetical protein